MSDLDRHCLPGNLAKSQCCARSRRLGEPFEQIRTLMFCQTKPPLHPGARRTVRKAGSFCVWNRVLHWWRRGKPIAENGKAARDNRTRLRLDKRDLLMETLQ
ncbi:hypothetical protein [Klebsiella phage vB_KshKPC-M]|nr:hypothetical protein [Klebsiella phage vB_KshKPC-M]